ncbi:hypothetical protein BUALT_Bualt09G0102000 [Buddleja alternifolia]|uniref:Dof zinc finger protein n=1 Tax=Buddleja alternifolia TaxID=168488 RepID=A0AAV6X9I9_9LAMI|nr:hypothetical protein BUALT_Bualt09G0102000 [Buddleja alternifolia]
MERGWKPNAEVSPACPRCGSSNTKFCYYNNYSLTQPRYFCKGCRRYWTKGGSLRNVPVGGGCRKSRRGKSIRVSTDAAVANSRALPHNGIESSSSFSSSGPDNIPSSSIDLAAVYANFLSPKPRVESASAMPDGIVVNIPPVEFQNFQMNNSHLHQESGFLDCGTFPGRLLSETQLLGDNSMFFSGFDSFQKQTQQNIITGNNFIIPSIINPANNVGSLLPPLPGEDVAVSEGMLWPGPDLILPNQIHETTSAGMVEPAAGQNSELLGGNMSTFSELNLEAIFRS